METSHFTPNDILEVEYHAIGSDSRIGQEHFDNSVEIFQFWSLGGHFIVKGNIYPITPGTIVFANAIHPHYSNPEQISTYNRSKIVISYRLFLKLAEICGITDYVDTLFLPSGGFMLSPDANKFDPLEIDQFFKYAASNYPVKQGYSFNQAHIIDAVIRILISVFTHISETKRDPQETTTLHLLAEYLNRPFNSYNDFSMKGLCQHLHISPSYASHLFKKLTNKSLSHYIMELRISEAKKMLLTTDLKVGEIAEYLQFSDAAAFCKTFKKYTSCTPNSYRKNNGISLSTME